MNRCVLILLSLALTILALSPHEEAGFGGFHLLQKPAGVAAVGRGYTGIVSQSTFSHYYNPAMYGKRDGFGFGIEYSNGTTSELQSTQFEVGFSVKSLFIALEAANHTIGGIYLTGEFPEGVDYDRSSEWQFSEMSFSIGSRPLDDLLWAVTMGGAFDQFEAERAYALLFGGGVTYEFLDDALMVGASALNWGFTTPMWGEGNETLGEGEDLPSTLGLGVGYTHNFGQVKLLATVDGVYTHRFSSSTRQVASSVGERISVPLGVEVTPVPWATVRVGKRINGGSDVVNFGAGFVADWITTDFAFVIHSLEEQTSLEWMASINMAFGRSEQKKNKIVVKEPLIVTPLAEPAESVAPQSPVIDEMKDTTVSSENLVAPDSIPLKEPKIAQDEVSQSPQKSPEISSSPEPSQSEKTESTAGIKKEEELELIQ